MSLFLFSCKAIWKQRDVLEAAPNLPDQSQWLTWAHWLGAGITVIRDQYSDFQTRSLELEQKCKMEDVQKKNISSTEWLHY